MKNEFKLSLAELDAIDKAFNTLQNEYETNLPANLKIMEKNNKLNTTSEFMLYFVHISNLLILGNILNYSLQTVIVLYSIYQ